ncbi:MAG: cyclic nucleotide-binding domain-containing protein [Elusimicrobia bacterium]|jgi:CRP-like cAMP-binding protein|nr:cyclic nucleotide-binding domain-containing protein [Elusimicrobiota bacterium]
MEEILSKTKIFKGLTKKEFSAIKSIAKEKKFKEGDSLFKKGQEGGALYVIVSGIVDISVNIDMEWGLEEIRLARMDSGDIIGELSFFDGHKRSAEATAFVNSELLIIDKKDYDKLVKENKDLGLKILNNVFKLVSKRLRRSNTSVSDMARNLYFY